MSEENKHIADTISLKQYQAEYKAAVEAKRQTVIKAIIRLGKIAGYTESEIRNEQE